MSQTASIGVVICNYNKSQYVVNCIQSVLESDINDYTIYVVDNASTDDSVVQIEKNFKDRVLLLQNEENLGGSGGFNRGLREALAKGHPYIMCLDNDVLVDEAAISTLFFYMQEHPEVGMLGSRVYHMEEPDYVQQFGLNIDFDNYIVETLYADVYEDGTIPVIVNCDTVATCSVMVRAEAIRKVGLMPEDNFIYWDDMEWGYLIGKAGYRVAACGDSKVLHTKGAGNRNNAVFTNYYNVRNRIHFFMKFIKDEQLQDFASQMLDSVFDSMYERMYRDEHCCAQAIRYGLEDAMHGVRGKADGYKLRQGDELYDGLARVLHGKKRYCLEVGEYIQLADSIREYIHTNHPELEETDRQSGEATIVLCDYIMNIKDFSLEKVYVDEYMNVFSTGEEAELITGYVFSKALFLYMNQELFVEQMKKLRRKYVV